MRAGEIATALERLDRAVAMVQVELDAVRAAMKAQPCNPQMSRDAVAAQDLADLLRCKAAQREFKLAKSSLRRLREKHPELFFRSEGTWLVRRSLMATHLRLNPLRRRAARRTLAVPKTLAMDP